MSNIVKRYKRNDESVQVYHDEHDRLMLQSRILNADAVPFIGSFIFSKRNIQDELTTLVGEENGLYTRDHQLMTGQIPYLQEKLDELEKRFNKTNLERELNGLPTYESYPAGLMKEKLKIEAALDVALSEKAFLEERLKTGLDKEEQARKDNILKYGLRQSVQMKDGLIETIDGQSVIYQDDKPIISEGIYYGMLVSDYRKLSNEWLEERRKAEENAFKKLCEARRRNNLPVPTQKKVSSIKAIDKSSLPKFPSWAERHLKA